MFWIAFGVLRAVSRRTRSPGQAKQEWQPFTKLVWAVFIFGIPIAIGGGWRVASFVILGLIAVSVVAAVAGALVYAIVHRNDEPATPADPLAQFFTDKEGSKP
jgi:hypothetical protein